ncbi:MAG: TRIC cation channel family protein [Campylobacterota bacterium]|nr:TRIC cation channel family protein [Campylobacterota bacterium]
MFEVAEFIGIIAFALSGFSTAVKNNLDLLGVLIAVFLTALGGGILRDITVGVSPYTFTHTAPALVVFIVLLILISFKVHRRDSIETKPYFIVSDSIGLVAFSITGALVALNHNFNFAGVLMVSFAAAVGGGIIRDIIINEVPFIFKTGFYGSVSIVVALLVYLLNSFDILLPLNIAIIFLFGVILRVVAYYQKWSIPLK